MDASIATAVSYLNVAFRRRNRIRQARFRMRLQRMQALYKRFIALYQRQMLYRMIVTAGLIFAMSIPAERSLWCKKKSRKHEHCTIAARSVGESKMAHKFGISRGTCQGQVTSLPVILGRLRINAFTLQNLFHVLGSKLPHGGGLDPHCRCGIDVASKPHILCSHYAGKWGRPGSTPWPCIKWA